MARNQKNFNLFTYVDDNALTWNVRGEDGGAGSAVDGHAPFTPGAPRWERQSARQHIRHVIAQDPTSFRTIQFPVYTPTAYAAITIGQVIGVDVAGLATPVDYDVTRKVAEAQAGQQSARQLIF
jgi:hypothetical protein